MALAIPLASMVSRLPIFPSAMVATSTTSEFDVGTTQTIGAANCDEPYASLVPADVQQPAHACQRGPVLPCAPAVAPATIPIAMAMVVYFAKLRIPMFLMGNAYSRY